jgi:hypothetical protein
LVILNYPLIQPLIKFYFRRITHKHGGNLLAKSLHNCVERYGLSSKERDFSFFSFLKSELIQVFIQVFSLVMDNAGNCDTLGREYAILNPHFGGDDFRIRCIAHTLQLVVFVRNVSLILLKYKTI